MKAATALFRFLNIWAFVFLLIIPFVQSLSFNFERFRPSNVKNITFERTSVANNSIQLTSNQQTRIGRATYAEPLHLWDKASGDLSGFNTHFAFVIDSNGNTKYGDGFAFFLAPAGSRIPPNATKGAGFGLVNDDESLNSSNPFVAVEFDIHMNVYDTEQKQVGIDVNSVLSIATATWDIKSSNIMLDSNLNAKLGDFGLARLVDHEKGSRTTAVAGTMGYIALECVVSGKASKETDMYSFGIVTLEIACGRKPIDLTAEETRVNIVEWVWKLYGTGQLLDAADANLSGEFNRREVEQMMIVGLWCAHPDCTLRPSIRQAIQVLNFDAPLPDLPETMPIATFRPQPNLSSYGSQVSHTSQTQPSIYSGNTNCSSSSAV
nr:L-type lectin-domain containing receptor kinase IX.1-like [Ipomoea trifida]